MFMKDIGARLRTFNGGIANATAGGSGDNTELDGVWVDRSAYESAKLVLHYRATLAANATLTIAANAQDASSSGGAGAADFGTAMPVTTVATGPAGGGTVSGTVELDFNLDTAKQFVRAQFTPNLSAANTDTCTVTAVWVFGGARRQPISARVNA